MNVPKTPDDGNETPRAFVLCGGLGTRLRAVLSDRPKSMAPVAGVPFLQLLLENLKAQGVEEVVLGTGYPRSRSNLFSGWATLLACVSIIRASTNRSAPAAH